MSSVSIHDRIDEMVIEDPQARTFRVLRESLVSESIYAMERERIFERCWLYAGHDSEIPEPGDYVRRDVGGKPIILSRDKQGTVNALFNSCTHRGARVCRQDQGNATSFQCFYHAWTFGLDGALRGLPDEEGYGPDFDRSRFALHRPARLEQYRGFWFIAYDPEIESLSDYLAGAKEYIDVVVDQGVGHGGMRIVTGSQPYSCGANWKLMVENSMDGYHGVPVHQTYFEFIANRGDVSGLVKNLQADAARGYSLGNGHAVVDYPAPFPRPVAQYHPVMGGEEVEADVNAAFDDLVVHHGETRATRLAKTCRNLFLYPNTLLLDVSGLTIRTIWPTAADHMNVTAWALAPADEDGPRLKRRLEGFNLFLGPGGLATPDDIEALEACQEGYAATAHTYSDISRGMHRDPKTTDEAQMRAFWREWHAQMRSAGHATQRELRDAEPDEWTTSRHVGVTEPAGGQA